MLAHRIALGIGAHCEIVNMKRPNHLFIHKLSFGTQLIGCPVVIYGDRIL